MTWLWIGVGGAAGAMLRYGMGQLAELLFGKGFPYGTLSVNVLGSLLIGLCYVLLVERAGVSEAWRLGLIVGVLGAFTTFSSFSLETLQLVDHSSLLLAFVNVLANVLLCLAACMLGLFMARQWV